MSALHTVQKLFPNVKKVKDATSNVSVTVTKEDAAKGKRKAPGECALARACVRTKIADGALIGLSTSYLIHGETAIRYKNNESISREIVSFDRHQDFAPGQNYLLAAPAPKCRLGIHKKGGPHTGKGKPRTAKYHRTAYVRKIKNL